MDVPHTLKHKTTLSDDPKFHLWLDAVLDNTLLSIMALRAIRDENQNIIDFEYLFLNKKAEESVNRFDLTGKRFLEEFPGGRDSGLFKHYVEVTETDIPWNDEIYYNHDGHEFWSLVKASKLNDGCLVIYEDITQKKKAEQEVLKLKDELASNAEDKYLRLFNSIDQGFCIIEMIYDKAGNPADYRFLEVNTVFEKQTGLKDAAGKTMREMVPEHEEHWFRIYDEIASTGQPRRFENSAAHLAGGVFYEVYAFKVGKAENKNVAILFSDITERKNQEQNQAFLLKFSDSLRNEITPETISNLALQMLFEHLKLDCCYIGVFRINEDIGEFPHQVRNDSVPPLPRGVRLSDFPDALREAFDRTLVIDDIMKSEILSGIDKQNFSAMGFGGLVVATLRKGENNPLWSVIVVSAKPRHWLQVEIKLVEEVAERTWAAIERAKAEERLKDLNGSLIIKRKQAEAAYENERLANVELRRMNEVMDTFVYAAAHDLKAPISNLKLISEVFGITEDSQLRLKIMERIQPVVQTLDKTVSGLVNVLAIESGKNSETKEVQFQQILNLILAELKEKVVVINPEIKTDFTRCNSIGYIESYIFSIFRNMISNALKYRSDVQKLVVDIRSEMKGNYILLTFIDNGIGIDLEKYGNDLFKPFKRFSSLSEGNGIGLHLIKSIVTKNGGKIDVKSTLNKGTTFNIYLKPYSK